MKTTSIVLYILASIILILTLTFGSNASKPIVAWLEDKLHDVEITEVTMELDQRDLLAGSSYRPIYTAHGEIDGDAGLVFTSLDPEYLTVSSNGVLYADKDFDGNVFETGIKITSKYDTDFEQIINLTFIKKYPDDFSVYYYSRGYGYSSNTLYIGVPVYVFAYSNVESDYNVINHETFFNEEYFKKLDDGSFLPIKATEPDQKLSFTARYGNGAEGTSKEFTIAELPVEMLNIDEIRVEDKNDDVYEINRYATIEITLFSGGQKVHSDYTLTFDDDSNIKINRAGNPAFDGAGDRIVTITAPNGFSRTVLVKVRNIIKTPVLVDAEIEESRYIKLLDTDTKRFTYTIEKGTTYESAKFEYDEDIIQVSAESRAFKITAKKAGTTTLKLIMDDGYTRIEETYTVEVVKDSNIIKGLAKNARNFVGKVLGHCFAFMLLAFAAMNMFKYFDIENPAARFSLYSLTGLPIAAITEFIQFFMPARDCRVLDIFIDMTGFYLGTLIVVLIRSLRDK